MLNKFGALVGGTFIHQYHPTLPAKLPTSSALNESYWYFNLPREILNAENLDRWLFALSFEVREVSSPIFSLFYSMLVIK
jgi:hypothetical protein